MRNLWSGLTEHPLSGPCGFTIQAIRGSLFSNMPGLRGKLRPRPLLPSLQIPGALPSTHHSLFLPCGASKPQGQFCV
jgi:hypothetical protein